LATNLGATYLTRRPFIGDLLQSTIPHGNDFKTDIFNATLQLELPVLTGITLDSLMELRQHDGDAFETFRIELERNLREIRQLSDPLQITTAIENVRHELSEVQLREVNKKVVALKKRMVPDAAILVGGLALTTQSQGLGLAAILYALEHGYKTYLEYVAEVKQNPAYFLWKMSQKQE
jgi:hypothetical protein